MEILMMNFYKFQKGTNMQEINLIDHPFKREMMPKIANEYKKFDFHYFDDPKVTSGFRGFHESYNAAEGSRDHEAEAKMIATVPGVKTVLDVGCAKGFLVKALRNLGLQAYGVDISEYAIGKAESGMREYLRVMKVQDLDETETYDVIHMNGVLLYLGISEINSALKKFHSISSIGIIAIQPVREQFMLWYDNKDIFALDPLRKQELSQHDWDNLIENAGFCKQDIYYKKTI
jgi:SAM-dependent methyltransferase